jgi:hypothetical protein
MINEAVAMVKFILLSFGLQNSVCCEYSVLQYSTTNSDGD